MYTPLLILAQALSLVQALPAIISGSAQHPNDVIAVGTTTLPSPSVAPGTTGVSWRMRLSLCYEIRHIRWNRGMEIEIVAVLW